MNTEIRSCDCCGDTYSMRTDRAIRYLACDPCMEAGCTEAECSKTEVSEAQELAS